MPVAAGLWGLDLEHEQNRDVYGEIRVARETEDSVYVSMVDYGAAWVDGAFRTVLRVIPWTFRVGRWRPRRGPEGRRALIPFRNGLRSI